jgi:hypothetical protein
MGLGHNNLCVSNIAVDILWLCKKVINKTETEHKIIAPIPAFCSETNEFRLCLDVRKTFTVHKHISAPFLR